MFALPGLLPLGLVLHLLLLVLDVADGVSLRGEAPMDAQ